MNNKRIKSIVEWQYEKLSDGRRTNGRMVYKVVYGRDGNIEREKGSIEDSYHFKKPQIIQNDDNRITEFTSSGQLMKYYYPNGKLKLSLGYSANGSYRCEYTYDSEGKLLKENYLHQNGESKNAKELFYNYDKKGNLVEIFYETPQGQVLSYSCSYDQLGRKLKEKKIDESQSTLNYIYDSSGDVVVEEVFSFGKVIKKYNEKKHLCEQISYSEKNELQSRVIYGYDERSRMTIVINLDYLGNVTFVQNKEYDNADHLVQEVYCCVKKGCAVNTQEHFQFDEQGNMTERTFINRDGDVLTYEWKYKYYEL